MKKNQFEFFKRREFNKLYQKNAKMFKYETMETILESYNCAYEEMKQ